MSNSAAAESVAPDISALPPMLRQYVEYKHRHAECIIFFQVGDFYEIFFEDAVLVARTLNLTLTSRDKSSESPIPMCGVPVSSLDSYIERLVDCGMSVAVVSQINQSSFSRLPSAYKEENSQGKITISRELTRIITPGIRLLGENSSDVRQTYIMSVNPGTAERIAICYSDPQSGIIHARSGLTFSELYEEVARVAPAELILPRYLEGQRLDGRSAVVQKLRRAKAELIVKFRDLGNLRLNDQSSRNLRTIEGFKVLDPEAQQAVALMTDYVDETTVGAQVSFLKIINDQDPDSMIIGATTRTNLELLTSATAGPQGGLLFAIDRTKSAGGARKFRSWLLRPLRKAERICERYDVVEFLKNDAALRSNIRSKLELAPDLERLAARLELQCISPRELGALRDLATILKNESLIAVESLMSSEALSAGKLALLRSILERLKLPVEMHEILQRSLCEELPAQLSDGGIIREGYNSELDQLRSCQQEGRSWVQEFEKREQIRSGISNLRVKFNYVLGFYIEVTKSQLAKVPNDYEKRQATTSADRFVTAELKAREKGVLGADEKALGLERQLFFDLRSSLRQYCPQLRICAEALSELDVLSSLAELADSAGYVRPEINETTDLIISNGRHPVVERLTGNSFVPNSLELSGVCPDSEKQTVPAALILTGPNMGGKSTYLRQAGVLSIMAQMGSFVPAREMKIGIIDQIFARIGASDNLAGGESTFMVEMREVVQIISASSRRSLILIDEVGRGTATADGAALAQAIIEWLVKERGCRILFATHFHNLTELPEFNRHMSNISVAAVEDNGEILFTHQIKKGAAGHSYGLEVAKLAGLPDSIIARSAQLVASSLSHKPFTKSSGSALKGAQMTLPIGLASSDQINEVAETEQLETARKMERIDSFRQEINDLNLNALTPLEAMLFLSDMQKKINADL